jgi:hypothetical protein
LPFPRDAGAAVQLQDPLRDVVEEVAVVGDGHDGAGELLEVALEPGDRLGVQVVGRLIQQQHVRLLEQDLAEGDAAALAADSVETSASAGGRRSASMAISILRSRSHALHRLDAVLQRGLLVDERLHLVVGHGLGELHVHLVEATEQVADGPHRLLHVARTSRAGSSTGSCGR